MATNAPSATEYIQHHMQHLQSLKQNVIIDFSVVNYDTIFFSVLALLAVFFILRLGAKKATSGVPGKMQCAVEMLVEMVDNQAKNLVHGDRTFIAPLALTVFCWVAMMNCIDLIPVDLFPAIAGLFGVHYLRPLPTADLNGTLGLSLGVLLLLFYYGIKVKSFSGFVVELFTAPFGKFPLLWPFISRSSFRSVCDCSATCTPVNWCSSSLRFSAASLWISGRSGQPVQDLVKSSPVWFGGFSMC